jgi:hypothetical protein
MRSQLEELIEQMLNGNIMLDEALNEFEKLYIQKALARHKDHLSRTANVLGIHRNTLAKKVAVYKAQERVESSRFKVYPKKNNSNNSHNGSDPINSRTIKFKTKVK